MKRVLLKFKIIFIFLLFYMCTIEVFGYTMDNNFIELDEKMYINPDWIEYIKLSKEEKLNYEAIPEQYIYDYVFDDNLLNKYNNNFFSLKEDESKKPYFTLANVDGKRYVNSSNKDQGSLGLCWAFASLGAVESNIMLNGIKDTEICTENNKNSKYCQKEEFYENDQKLNDYYIDNAISCESGYCLDIDGNLITDSSGKAKKVVIDNATFSERNIDYLRSKPYTSNAYNNTNGSFTLIKEQYNPYTTNGQIGSGGSYSNVGTYLGYGITPIRMSGIWEKYTANHNTYTLEEVFDSEKNLYKVTNYYIYPASPSSTDSNYQEKLDAWVNELKNNIVKYGSLYVSTGVPDSRYGSCYFNDTTNGVKLMNNTGNCNGSASHALQIIGWDDDYTFAYCKTINSSGKGVAQTKYKKPCEENNTNSCEEVYTKNSCEEAGYIWTEGKGAWIIKNSWGAGTTLYPYLSYQSTINSLFGVREVKINNFDNSYNEKNSKRTYTSKSVNRDDVTVKENIFTYKKSANKEYLNSFNIYSSSSKIDAEVYISNGGEYKYLDTIYIDYVGLYTIDLDNYELFGNEFSVKIIGPSISTVNAFTINECTLKGNCTTDKEIHSYIDSNATTDVNYFPVNNTTFKVYTITKNVSSGTKLNYKIINEAGNDVSSKFNLNSNYVVNNANVGSVELIDEISTGKYTLEITLDNLKEEFSFNIEDEVLVEFDMKNPIFVDDKNVKITPKFSYDAGVSSFTWSSSNTSVATIDNNGILKPIKSGITNITFTATTNYGKVTKRVEIYIYEKINNVNDFMNMLENGNRRAAYYLTNDLDFKDINFNNYNEVRFVAIFNGGNHTLKNIHKKSNSDTQAVGLFNLSNSAVISNLRIEESTFEGLHYVGSVFGQGSSVTISNVYSSATIKSASIAGGIIGFSMNSEVSNTYFDGDVTVITPENDAYAGGIIGMSQADYIYDSYNDGNVHAETNYNALNSNDNKDSIAGGIVGSLIDDSYVDFSYNTGKVEAKSSNSFNGTYSNGLFILSDSATLEVDDCIINSYYLYDNTHTIKYDDKYSRTIEQLKTKSNYIDWNFNETWYINEYLSTPSLINFPVESNEVKFNIFSNVLNDNYIYDYSYEILPYSFSKPLTVYSEDEELFEVNNNKIITKDKTGTSNIVFKIGDKIFKFPISIKDALSYTYDENLTNKDISVKIQTNYFDEALDENSYLKLVYNIGVDEYVKEFEKNSAINEYTFKVNTNNEIKLDLYICNSECNKIKTKSFNINNIDKEKPILNYVVNNISNTLQINVKDIGVSGLNTNNQYKYAISNNNTIVPSSFKDFIPNTIMNNVNINEKNKYLWIKNISDNVGNKLSDNDYVIFEMDIQAIYYTINYYDEFKNKILKTEQVKENDIIILNYIPENYEDNNYYYEFDYWKGFKEGLVATTNFDFIAVYKKIPKLLKSDIYIIENNFIKNIKLDDINKEYNTELFISNIINSENYHFYNNNNDLLTNVSYINTGLKFKSPYNEYIIVLAGDVTGDGKVRMNDVMKIANHLVNQNVLFNEFLAAGDVTNDDNTKMNDVMKIANALVNGGNL